MLRFHISSLMVLTAAIAVTFGLGRLLLQGRAPLELDRALAQCDMIRIQCPKHDPECMHTWDITKPEAINEVRKLFDIPSAREDPTETLILGGPALGVTLLQKGEETASFYVVHSLLTTPAYPEYKQRHYALPSGEAWSLLLELSEPRR